jgi:hypothetical protein
MNRSVLKAKEKIAFYFSRYFFYSRVYGQKKRIVFASELIKNKSTFLVFPFFFLFATITRQTWAWRTAR